MGNEIELISAGAGFGQAGSEVAANAGRWVKLTDESAKAMKVGQLMKGSSGGVSRAVVTSSNGKITGLLEIVKPGSVGSVLTNPAMLAGAAGIMAQMAMQQSSRTHSRSLNWTGSSIQTLTSWTVTDWA